MFVAFPFTNPSGLILSRYMFSEELELTSVDLTATRTYSGVYP